jgi:hypothetical protein
MQPLARRAIQNGNGAEELHKLGTILDKSYAKLREQARLQWQRRCPEADSSDACVHVRIRARHRRLTI